MARSWRQLLEVALSGIYPALEAMTDSELRNVRSAPRKRTNTNCWWLSYEFAPDLAEIADGILKMRYAARRKMKRERAAPMAPREKP